MQQGIDNTIDEELIEDIAGGLVNFQDTALLLAAVFGFTREEITNLTIDAINDDSVTLKDGGSTRVFKFNDLSEKFLLAARLRAAFKSTTWYSYNGHGGTRFELIENGDRVFKDIEGMAATLDERLQAIGELHSMKDEFTFVNLKKSGQLIGAF